MTTTPAPTGLDTLKALLDAMPEGPWRVALSQPSPGIRTAAGWEVVHASYDDHLSVLEFIAAARNALPALLDELANERWLRENAGKVCDNAVAATHEIAKQRDAALSERDAARKELAKTRAELETARAVALSNKRAHATAFEECERLAAELERLRAVPGVAVLDAPLCPCRPNAATLHMKDCPVWVNIGPNLAQRQYVRRDSLANPATTAEPAALPLLPDIAHMTTQLPDDDAPPMAVGIIPNCARCDGHMFVGHRCPDEAEPADEPKAKRRCAAENCDGTPLPADLVCDRHPACSECGGRAMHDLWCKTARARRLAGVPAVPPAYDLPPKHCGELRVHAPHIASGTFCDGRTLPDAEPAAS